MLRRPLGAVALTVAACLVPFASRAEMAVPVAAFDWNEGRPGFGGFSGIEVSDDGSTALALTDSATVVRLRLIRDGDAIVGVDPGPLMPLKDVRGQTLRRADSDAEGLALAPGGGFYVSFENAARVAFYPAPDGPSRPLPQPAAFRRMQKNSSLEALAIDRDGTLYTLPERSGDTEVPFPVWRYRDGAWDQPFSIPREGLFLAVGADIGPDGRFYLLEREFALGFRSRVRRFELGPAGLTDETTLLSTRLGDYYNLEGLSVWQDAGGTIRLTMIADDNFQPFLKTQIVEFRVPPLDGAVPTR